MELIKRVVYKHADRLLLDREAALGNALGFAHIVGLAENNGKLVGKNPTSTAKGLYQFINGSVGPAVVRAARTVGMLKWMQEALEHRDFNRLNWEQQTLLFLADVLEKKGGDRYMRPVLATGSLEAMEQAYYKLHHTAPDEMTIKNWKRKSYVSNRT